MPADDMNSSNRRFARAVNSASAVPSPSSSSSTSGRNEVRIEKRNLVCMPLE